MAFVARKFQSGLDTRPCRRIELPVLELPPAVEQKAPQALQTGEFRSQFFDGRSRSQAHHGGQNIACGNGMLAGEPDSFVENRLRISRAIYGTADPGSRWAGSFVKRPPASLKNRK
jgi:hypothetical protein